jgi:hypothetical protein
VVAMRSQIKSSMTNNILQITYYDEMSNHVKVFSYENFGL